MPPPPTLRINPLVFVHPGLEGIRLAVLARVIGQAQVTAQLGVPLSESILEPLAMAEALGLSMPYENNDPGDWVGPAIADLESFGLVLVEDGVVTLGSAVLLAEDK